MDARAVLLEWIGPDPDDPDSPMPPDRRGKRGTLLQGTSPARYGQDVADWLGFIEDTVRIGAWRAEVSHIKTWLDMKQGPTGSERSRARRISALGAFYTFAVHFGYTRTNPVNTADSQLSTGAKNTPKLPKLSMAEMHLLRWGADQLDSATATRDRLIMYLMLSGMRSRQITELNVQQLAFEQSRLVAEVWQKGGGTRPVAFDDEVRTAVRTYMADRAWRPPTSWEESGPLLVTHRPGGHGHRLNPRDMPRHILRQAIDHALRCPDSDAPELSLSITPDIVAHSPSPFPLEELQQRRVRRS